MLKIVDGLREKPHVTSNDHFGRNEGIVGISDYVLNAGRMFETELISSNELRIYDGEGMIQGCHWRILPGTYETVKLSNGTQGKKRIDYVVARYEKNSVGYEDIGISVKEGEATSGNPKPPAYITGDIRTGDTIREMVLAEIEYEGINVVEVTPKFKVLMTMAELQEKTDELNRKLILYEWETTVKPFASINPGNKLTFTVRKIGRVCTGNILWVGSVSGTNATLTDFTIPEPFRPIKTEYYSASLISSGKVFGSSRLDISNLGKVTYATDQEGFVERYVSFSYIGNDITPDEMYLVDNL